MLETSESCLGDCMFGRTVPFLATVIYSKPFSFQFLKWQVFKMVKVIIDLYAVSSLSNIQLFHRMKLKLRSIHFYGMFDDFSNSLL